MDKAEVLELQEEVQFLRDRNIRLTRKNEELQKQMTALQKELEEVKRTLSETLQNGVRRQKNKSWMERYEQVAQMEREGVSPTEGARRTGLSRTTYYRYAREYKRRMGLQSENK